MYSVRFSAFLAFEAEVIYEFDYSNLFELLSRGQRIAGGPVWGRR
jgi:hypothetical protein